MFRRIIIISVSCIFICTSSLQANEEEKKEELKPKRPKIALVLGGGGARGGAHIGVLKVLEENNVPIDFVVGTSMGAIVGALYSSGMTPEEIEETVNKIDWSDLFQDRPDEEYLSFRNKRDQERLMALEMGVKKGKLRLPRGVVSGQKLSFELKKLTMPVAHITNFDDLPIPFRAVATDLQNGQVVVHKSGSLSDAIRSSMSIPGVFPPAEVDGRLLVDGFVVDNVPVDVAKAMGADIIIAVDVGIPPTNNKNFDSLLDVTSQLIALLSQQNVDKSRALLTDKDLLIEPDLGNMKPDNFVGMAKAIKAGEATARGMVDQIKRYSITEEKYVRHLDRRQKRQIELPIIDFVKVQGPNRTSDKAILGRIKTKPGEKLDLNKLQKDLTRIYSINDFETVDFKVTEEKGKTGLIIDPVDKPWGPNYLHVGLNLSSNTSDDSEYSGLLDYRMTHINSLGAEWKTVAELGETYGIMSEFYQPLDTQDRFFIMPFVQYRRDLSDIYQNDDLIAEYETHSMEGGVGAGINFGSIMQARIDYLSGVVDASPQIGGTALPSYDGIREGALKYTIDYDQLDNHKFPKTGVRANAVFFDSMDELGADFEYKKLYVNATKATTMKRHTVLTTVHYATTIDENAPFYDEFKLGGFLALSGYGQNQLRGQNLGLGQVIYYYRLLKDPFGANGNIYLGGGLEYGNVWDQRSDMEFKDGILSGLAFIGVDSSLGPIYLGYAQADGGPPGRLYLFLGKTF